MTALGMIKCIPENIFAQSIYSIIHIKRYMYAFDCMSTPQKNHVAFFIF